MSILNDVLPADKIKPPKGIIYGPPGVGKTTFAAGAPNPILIDCENGVGLVKVKKTPYLRTWPEIVAWLEAIAKEKHEYETCIIDTIDWALRRLEEFVSSSDGRDQGFNATLNRSHGGYGNGRQVLMNYAYGELLPLLDAMINRGITVVLLAHSARQSLVTIDGVTVEKSAPDIHEKLANTFIEWSDFVGAARIDGDDRILILNETNQQLAKNRYRINTILPLEWNTFTGAVNENFKSSKTKE